MIKIETLVSLLPKLFMGCVWSFDWFSIQLKIFHHFFWRRDFSLWVIRIFLLLNFLLGDFSLFLD